MELDKELRRQITRHIQEGRPLPISTKALLFPPETKQMEYELIYGIKEREEDILADTMSVPFQPAKQFGTVRESEWHNMLIFGDNLQALKFMMKDPGIKGKVKLIYIDPPFGTGELYDAAGVPAYSAALQGAAFVEFLRKRLILLKKLLADDGSIYVRIDYHFGHYIKVIMDEVFGKHNFRNEIVVNRIRKNVMISQKQKGFPTATDSVFFYVMSNNTYLNEITKKIKTVRKGFWRHMDDSAGQGPPRTFFGKTLEPPRGKHWKYSQNNIDRMIEERKLRLECKNCGYAHTRGIWRGCPKCGKDAPRPKYWVEPSDTFVLDTNWTDIPGYTFQWEYPTENSEQLLERIIKASSYPGDIVLDCFAGSGTTGAVAEKLGRRWIMGDSSKLAIYTMIKRMFNLKRKIGNKGDPMKPKPFVLYNAGLYEDHAFILSIGEEKYKKFAMELFQVEPKWSEINGLRMDGVLFSCPVKVFSQKGFLTEEYVGDLHEIVGEYLKGRMFLIAPASRVYFLQDYIEKDGIRYYVLRIPYSVIDELHKKAFVRPLQPTSIKELNQLIEQVGFDFVHPPNVRSEYYRRIPKDRLTRNELLIEIKEFEPVQRAKEPIDFVDPKDALSMVLVDTDYNGKYFNLTHRFFADEIKKNGFIVRIPVEKVGNRIMIIYLDVLGNERVEVKAITDFARR